jgi:hypothetical protein
MKTDQSEKAVQGAEGALSAAGSVLATLRRGYRKNRQRRKIKKLTGYLGHGQRAWRGRRVILPDGRQAEIYAAVRGLVGLVPDPTVEFRASRLLFKANQLRLWKHPGAVLLGQAKAGVTEKKSLRKAYAARLNGSRPPRPGSRPRGRPRATLGH